MNSEDEIREGLTRAIGVRDDLCDFLTERLAEEPEPAVGAYALVDVTINYLIGRYGLERARQLVLQVLDEMTSTTPEHAPRVPSFPWQ